jgi:hypothetical protein
MAIAALHRAIPRETVRLSEESLGRRFLRFATTLREVWAEVQEMRREAHRRYPHLEF